MTDSCKVQIILIIILNRELEWYAIVINFGKKTWYLYERRHMYFIWEDENTVSSQCKVEKNNWKSDVC